MHVVMIQSKQFWKTFYKVVFEDKEKLEQFKEVLAFYKEDIIDDRHPEPGDISLDAYVLLNNKVNSIDPDSEEELSFILHEVQDILTLLFYIMEYWYYENRKIKQLEKLNELQECKSKVENEIRNKLEEIRNKDFETFSTYICAAHEDPAVLQGESWNVIKSYIEKQRRKDNEN